MNIFYLTVADNIGNSLEIYWLR